MPRARTDHRQIFGRRTPATARVGATILIAALASWTAHAAPTPASPTGEPTTVVPPSEPTTTPPDEAATPPAEGRPTEPAPGAATEPPTAPAEPPSEPSTATKPTATKPTATKPTAAPPAPAQPAEAGASPPTPAPVEPRTTDLPPRLPPMQQAGWWTVFAGFTIGTVGGVLAGIAERQEDKATRLAVSFDLETGSQPLYSDVKGEYQQALDRGRAAQKAAIALGVIGIATAIAGVAVLVVDRQRNKAGRKTARRVEAVFNGGIGARF